MSDQTERERRLEAAILDIDAHATPFGEDEDGFVTGGYLISVGCLHRALGLVGRTTRPCRTCTSETHDCPAACPVCGRWDDRPRKAGDHE